MKVLNNNEMQAVSGAGLFDSVLGVVGNIFDPILDTVGGAIFNVFSPVLKPVIDSISQGLGDMFIKVGNIIGNIINDEMGPKQ